MRTARPSAACAPGVAAAEGVHGGVALGLRHVGVNGGDGGALEGELAGQLARALLALHEDHDGRAHAVAQQLADKLKQPFTIDNKPGGSYAIGTVDLVKSPPDGYTLAYGNVQVGFNNLKLKQLRGV